MNLVCTTLRSRLMSSLMFIALSGPPLALWKPLPYVKFWQAKSRWELVIISITRYRDIDRGFVERTISWRPYIVRYRARTHVSRVRCSHTAESAFDSCRSPCTPSVDWLPLPHIPCGRPIMQRIGSLGWGLGDGSCTSGGLNYACRKAYCARRTAYSQSRNDVNTAAPVQCPLTLTAACCCVRTSQCNVTPVLITKPLS